MDKFRTILSDHLSIIPKEMIPIVSFGLVIIAVFLIFVFFVLCIFYINSQQRPKPITAIKRDDLVTKKKEEEVPKEIKFEDLPLISGRLGEILSLWEVLKVGPVTKIFFKALEVIKSSTYDIRWRYKLPCFMIIGPEGCGKSTLLNNLNFEELSTKNSEIDSMWKMFKEGVIFEFPKIESSEDKSKFWSFIGELFVFIRPRRPLDGIIVTIPADVFLSDIVNVEKQAREMFERIFQFQRDINFKVPIYFIITKTDLIPGFQEFVHLLHESSKQQMFGWSCPYNLDIAFTMEWINEIFSTLDEGIRKAVFYFARKREIDENLEKAVLFEAYFEKIKPILSTYLITMFRTHNPRDGLMLRGVYFVGKQKEITISQSGFVQVSALTPGVNVDVSLNHLHSDELYFVQDLFKDKIFREYNIAYPISTNTIGMSKNEYRNKFIFAGSALVISVGWFWGNSNIKTNIHSYCQNMKTIKKDLLKIKYIEDTLKSSSDQSLINNQTASLLQNMPVIKAGEFFSIFVPQSWLFSLSKAIKSTTELVFDSVVVKAMYLDLNFNTKNILLSSNIKTQKLDGRRDIFDVINFESFKNLDDFTNKVAELKKISSEYNSIRSLEDSKTITDLTESLFKDKFEISEELRKHVPNKKIISPKFNILDFQEEIEFSLKAVFDNFIKDVLDVTVEKVLESTISDIDRLYDAGKNAKVAYSVQDLAKLYNKVELTENIFKNKNFAWVRENKFCPTPKYQKIMETLQNTGVIRSDCLRDLTNFAEASFNRYRNRLDEFKSDLTGQLLDNLVISEGGLQLKNEIKSLLDLPFICVIPSGHFFTEIPSDKMLMWDVKRLKELSGLIDKYNEFSEIMPEAMRATYFDMYKTIAKKCFYPTIKAMIGNAEILEDMPMGSSRALLESAYKKQAENIRKASILLPKIVKIMDEIIDEENLEDFGFAKLIIAQYILLLEKIDALFNLEKPYSTNPALFDNWDGRGNPKFMNIQDPKSVKQYLDAQFARIRFLAKDLASPIIDLLTMPTLFDKIRDKNLVNKWKEIISNVDDYENLKPGNSIAALESFITENLSKVSLDNFDQEGEIKTISENTGDYFLSNRSEVAKSLMSRADIVQYEKAASSYNKITQSFNQKLAHKFPFGNSADEASVKDISDFVSLYESIDKSMYKILEKNADKKKINPNSLNFLKSIDSLMPFLKNWIAQSQSSDPNTCPVCFNVLLRPFSNMEAMTSAVIDRMLSINGVPVGDNANGAFFNNDKVMVLFGWIASANEKPDEKSKIANLRVEGNNAAFTYEGKWAMFRLIENHKMGKDVEYPNGVVLQFEVPVVSSNNNNEVLTSKMVFKITPMLRDGDKVTPITWPIFPEECPDLYGTVSKSQADIVNTFPAQNSTPRAVGTTVPISDTISNNAKPLDVDVSFDEQG